MTGTFVKDGIDEVADRFDGAVHSAQDTLDGAKCGVDGMVASAKGKLDGALGAAASKFKAMRSKAEDAGGAVADFRQDMLSIVKRHPERTIAITLAAGCVLGAFLMRSRD